LKEIRELSMLMPKFLSIYQAV